MWWRSQITSKSSVSDSTKTNKPEKLKSKSSKSNKQDDKTKKRSKESSVKKLLSLKQKSQVCKTPIVDKVSSKISEIGSSEAISATRSEEVRQTTRLVTRVEQCIIYLNVSAAFVAFYFLVLGVFAQYTQTGLKTYFLIFAIVSLFQLLGSLIGFLAHKTANKILLLLSAFLNAIFIICAALFVFLVTIAFRPVGFNQQVYFIVSICILLLLALLLASLQLVVMKQIGIITIIHKSD